MRKLQSKNKTSTSLSRRGLNRLSSPNGILSAIGNQSLQASLGQGKALSRNAPNGQSALEKQADNFSAMSQPSNVESGWVGGNKGPGSLPGGSPLSAAIRNKYQNKLGIPLENVRIYKDREANDAAHALNARAFTHGNNIVFADKHYQPNSIKGERLLAHELMHVAQQRSSMSVPAVQRDGGLWDEEESDRRDSRCSSSLNWSDGGHWIGSGSEPDCTTNRPAAYDACNDHSNWSDGGHWIGGGGEPDCSNTNTPGIALQQSLQRVSDDYWAQWGRNRERVLQTRENSASDAAALAQMFRSGMEDDGSAKGRLGTILSQTRHFIIPGLQTGIKFGDSGFRPEFQDSTIWPSSGNQVGHFLTAVRLGYDPGFLDSPLQRYILDSDENVETMALRLIVGHEQQPDPGILGTLASIIPLPGRWGFEEQYHSATDADIENFRQGNLSSVIVGAGKGNSMEDLALSYKGYILGQMIASGQLSSPEQIARWIEKEIGNE